MERRISKIDPLQMGKVQAVISFILSLLIFIPYIYLLSKMAIFSQMTGGENPFVKLTGGLLLTIPFIYAILGFIFGVLMSVAYNITYRFHGGFTFFYEGDNNK